MENPRGRRAIDPFALCNLTNLTEINVAVGRLYSHDVTKNRKGNSSTANVSFWDPSMVLILASVVLDRSCPWCLCWDHWGGGELSTVLILSLVAVVGTDHGANPGISRVGQQLSMAPVLGSVERDRNCPWFWDQWGKGQKLSTVLIQDFEGVPIGAPELPLIVTIYVCYHHF